MLSTSLTVLFDTCSSYASIYSCYILIHAITTRSNITLIISTRNSAITITFFNSLLTSSNDVVTKNTFVLMLHLHSFITSILSIIEFLSLDSLSTFIFLYSLPTPINFISFLFILVTLLSLFLFFFGVLLPLFFINNTTFSLPFFLYLLLSFSFYFPCVPLL